jgi:hypothetical protein
MLLKSIAAVHMRIICYSTLHTSYIRTLGSVARYHFFHGSGSPGIYIPAPFIYRSPDFMSSDHLNHRTDRLSEISIQSHWSFRTSPSMKKSKFWSGCNGCTEPQIPGIQTLRKWQPGRAWAEGAQVSVLICDGIGCGGVDNIRTGHELHSP